MSGESFDTPYSREPEFLSLTEVVIYLELNRRLLRSKGLFSYLISVSISVVNLARVVLSSVLDRVPFCRLLIKGLKSLF